MEVILLQDVKSLGKKGDLVKVNDNYARNYIIPKKFGLEANAKNLNDLKLKKANEEKLAQQHLEECQALAEKLKDVVIEVKIKVGEGGKTFGSVSAKEIVESAKKMGYDIDKKKLQIKDPIKSLGTYKIALKLHQKVTTELKVHVSAIEK